MNRQTIISIFAMAIAMTACSSDPIAETSLTRSDTVINAETSGIILNLESDDFEEEYEEVHLK